MPCVGLILKFHRRLHVRRFGIAKETLKGGTCGKVLRYTSEN